MLKTKDSRVVFLQVLFVLALYHGITIIVWARQHFTSSKWNREHPSATKLHVHYDYFYIWWKGLAWTGGILGGAVVFFTAFAGLIWCCDRIGQWTNNAPADKTRIALNEMTNTRDESKNWY